MNYSQEKTNYTQQGRITIQNKQITLQGPLSMERVACIGRLNIRFSACCIRCIRCCTMQRRSRGASVLYNTTKNATDKSSRPEDPFLLRTCTYCMVIQLVCNRALVVLLYCIVISLEIQYNTIRNADHTTVQHTTTVMNIEELTSIILPCYNGTRKSKGGWAWY